MLCINLPVLCINLPVVACSNQTCDGPADRPAPRHGRYGYRIRYSWGYLDADHRTAYWFVKQLHEDGCPVPSLQDACQSWPEALRLLAETTTDHHAYTHVINDRPSLQRWSSSHVTLVGDACHAVTPNNGQGACMAIEDAFVLGVLLKKYVDTLPSDLHTAPPVCIWRRLCLSSQMTRTHITVLRLPDLRYWHHPDGQTEACYEVRPTDAAALRVCMAR